MVATPQRAATARSTSSAAESAGVEAESASCEPGFASPESGAADLVATYNEELSAYAAELTPERLRDAYRHMVLTRAFDEESTALQRQGELGLWVPSFGQEAAQVGSALATPPDDYVFPSYREHAVAHVRGLDLAAIHPVLRGTRHGGWDPKAHHFHLYTFVIGAHTLHAVGYANGLQLDRQRGLDPSAEAVVCYLGDGATSQGASSEALVFAASTRAPVLFIVQNNQWAISVPVATQSRTPIAERADGFGIPRLRVDGNDLLASYAATRFALERVHRGDGPFYLELVTYRRGAHTTSDDPTRYRTRDEEAAWAARDPIARVRALLEREHSAEATFFDDVDAEARALRARVRATTRATRAGDPETMFDHVYATPNTLVDHERTEFADLRDRLGAP